MTWRIFFCNVARAISGADLQILSILGFFNENSQNHAKVLLLNASLSLSHSLSLSPLCEGVSYRHQEVMGPTRLPGALSGRAAGGGPLGRSTRRLSTHWSGAERRRARVVLCYRVMVIVNRWREGNCDRDERS